MLLLLNCSLKFVKQAGGGAIVEEYYYPRPALPFSFVLSTLLAAFLLSTILAAHNIFQYRSYISYVYIYSILSAPIIVKKFNKGLQ
jgi:hypothetical protein